MACLFFMQKNEDNALFTRILEGRDEEYADFLSK